MVVPESRINAARIAREARAVKPGQSSVRGRLRIPSRLLQDWEQQSTKDRGVAWALGRLMMNGGASYIVDSKGVTAILGEHFATGSTQQDALIKLLEEILSDAAND